MILALVMSLAAVPSEREYLTDRTDGLGAFMRCAARALAEDNSVTQYDALSRIEVDCHPFRDEAVKIFVPIYQKRMKSSEPITDAGAAERAILAVVLAEQMRREAEASEAK